MQKKKILLYSSLLILPLTFFVFQLFPWMLGLKIGYLVGFGFYWSYALALVFLLARHGKDYLKSIYTHKNSVNYRTLIQIITLIPVLGTFVVAFLPHVSQLSINTACLVLIFALFNGTIEEVYWRGLYLKEFNTNDFIGFWMASLLFGLWHISLWFIKDIHYQGGFGALVGGAFIMGLLWNFAARKLGNIRMVTIAHIGVNIFAFTGLFVENGF